MVRKTYKVHDIVIPQANDPTKTISKTVYESETHHAEDGMIGFEAPDATLVSNVLTPVDTLVVVRGEGAAADVLDHITFGSVPDIKDKDLLWLAKGAEDITINHNTSTPPSDSGPVLLLSKANKKMIGVRMVLLQRQGSNFQEIAFDGTIGDGGVLVEDDSGNAIIVCGSVASAINHLKVTNAAAGNDVVVEAIGGSTNIGIKFVPKGTGKSTFSGNVINEGRHQLDKGADIASASILTLGADGNIFNITGTTTINQILPTNWQSGSSVVLRFDGILTITNNSGGTNDILTGDGNNITTAAGFVLGLFFNGVDWEEEFRNTVGGGFSGTANRAVETDGSGNLQSSAVTTTELALLSGATGNLKDLEFIAKIDLSGGANQILEKTTGLDTYESIVCFFNLPKGAGTTFVPEIRLYRNSALATSYGNNEIINGAVSIKTNTHTTIPIDGNLTGRDHVKGVIKFNTQSGVNLQNIECWYDLSDIGFANAPDIGLVSSNIVSTFAIQGIRFLQNGATSPTFATTSYAIFFGIKRA